MEPISFFNELKIHFFRREVLVCEPIARMDFNERAWVVGTLKSPSLG